MNYQKMNYQELLEKLQKLTFEQRLQTVTIYVSSTQEYYPVVEDFPLCFAQAEVNDVLDPNHPYLVI